MKNKYHQPIMLKESVEALHIQPNGIYVDLTFGGGGHSQAILSQLNAQGKVWAFDQDPAARQEAAKLQDPRLHFIQGNFRFFTRFLNHYNIQSVHGILADLGVSSYQLDTPQRGFAARLEGPLDMRMNPQQPFTAATLLNNYNHKQLCTLFKKEADIHAAHRLVDHIIEHRKRTPFATITQFKKAIATCVPRQKPAKFYAKVFQALRITVNDEINALHDTLQQIPTILAPEGRLVVITYHSGEDRPVKNFIKTGNIEGYLHQDPYGNILRPLRPLHRKVIRANTEEITYNNRARSARMRIATPQALANTLPPK